MAEHSDSYRKRINIFSNPRLGEGLGTSDIEDNARVLRFVSYLPYISLNLIYFKRS